MSRSMNSPADSYEDHLKRLLDQRAARADMRSRSPSVSESMDTPSVYSNAVFSPSPVHRPDVLVGRSSYETSRARSPSLSESISPTYPREPLDDPVSMLDLDDNDETEPSFSYVVPGHPYGHEDNSRDEEELERGHDVEETQDTRISYLGPKMRFHSRAPWETSQDSLAEEEEPEEDRASFVTSSRGRGKFSKGEGIMKGLGLAPPSPRSVSVGRRGEDSARFQGRPKRSFETPPPQASHPRGRIPTLAQASTSSTSLISPPSNGTGRSQILPSHGRPHPAQPPIHSAQSSPSRPPFPTTSHSPQARGRPSHSPQARIRPSHSPPRPPRIEARSSDDSRSSSSSSKDEVHPYAHADLAVPHVREPMPASPLRVALKISGPSKNDSSGVASPTGSLSRSHGTSGAVPDTPAGPAPRQSRERTPSRPTVLPRKDISSPVALTHPMLKEDDPGSPIVGSHREGKLATKAPNGLAGWNDQPKSPTFTLISLEEARALRVRSSTKQPIAQPASGLTGLEIHLQEPSGQDAAANQGPLHHQAHVGTTSSRPRARSVSAGAKMKSTLNTIVGGTPPPVPKIERDSDLYQEWSQGPVIQGFSAASPGKPPLRNKKSGFMRLFNGREKEKERDKEWEIFPPPVLDSPTSRNDPNGQHAPPPMPQTPKIMQRVPVPPLTPSLTSSTSNLHANPLSQVDSKPDGSRSSSRPPSKRTPPLSINTSNPSPLHRTLGSSTSNPPPSSRPLISSSLSVDNASSRFPPQSAPPGSTDFPSLSLRPVSTLFSAHFADHIMKGADSPTPTFEGDWTPSTSPPETLTPITPGSSMRSINSRVTVSVNSEDQSSAVIQALQDQIISAKKAWQLQVWELEGQVKELKAEVEDLRAAGNDLCQMCGKGKGIAASHADPSGGRANGIVHRPRAKTGTTSRFGGA